MSIATAIQNAQQKVANAYIAISNKGGTLPETQDLSHMVNSIISIPTVNNTTLSVNPTTSAQSFTPSSPYTGYSSVSVAAVTAAIDANIVANNIKSGVSILGVAGNVVELKGETRTGQLSNISGNTFTPTTGKNGITSITVTPKNYARYITPTTFQQTIGVPSGYSGNGSITVAAVTPSIDSDIKAENIKQGVNILGVLGNYTGTQPTGTLSITENGVYDVTNYASANVNVSGGGGGGGGFNLDYQYSHDGGQHMSITLNGTTLTFPLFTGWGNTFGMFSRLVIPNIQTVTIDSDDYGYEGDCTVEFTSGGVTQSVPFGTTLILTQDSTLKISEGDCLLKGTLITMANGYYKEISQIKNGDKVLSLNPETLEQEEDEVTFCDGDTKKYNDNYDLWEFENNYVVRTTHHHRFYNVERQAFVYMDEFNIGEHTIDQKGNQIALLKHTNMEKIVHHFTIATKNWNNYFANGMLCGNRLSSEIHLGTEEQKQVKSTPSESIGKFLEY